ncbi:MAG: ABC transporter ATP-binding protein [Lachnospiraceae bacterium]|nr:ABC transporter ATP-binding protein [Lachnospiraceae bacterium]
MLLKLEHVKKEYDSFKLDCSLEVKKGQVTGLVGSNGAGKSTTFKSILGLIFPDEGNIELLGKDISAITASDKEEIGVVLTEANVCEYLTAKDLIPIMKAMYKDFSTEDYMDKCKAYGIPLKKIIKDFSTGMKAKLKVILAMSHNAKLLILDEPTAGLDVIMRNELLDMLRDYMENEERGILISSHISTDLEGLCDDIYMIANGKIIMHEETDVLLSEYGVLKLTKEQYETVDKAYILSSKEEKFGYLCLTNQKDFYMENYPEIAIEKGNIDDFIILMEKGVRK